MSAAAHVVTASERAALQSAMDASMTDDEAVGLIVEVVKLMGALLKVAAPEQQKELLPTFVRAGNMVPYVADRLARTAAVAELIDEAKAPAVAYGCEGHTGVHFVCEDRNECVEEAHRDGSRIVELIVRPRALARVQGGAQ